MCLQDDKFVNEFKILNNIGRGSFSKVKKVLRQQVPDPNSPETSGNTGGQDENNQNYFAMKVCNKLYILNFLTILYGTDDA